MGGHLTILASPQSNPGTDATGGPDGPPGPGPGEAVIAPSSYHKPSAPPEQRRALDRPPSHTSMVAGDGGAVAHSKRTPHGRGLQSARACLGAAHLLRLLGEKEHPFGQRWRKLS